MAIEEKVIHLNQNTPVVAGNVQPERFNVSAHEVREVSKGNSIQTLTAAEACANAGLPIQWATEGLVKGHGCPDQKTTLRDVSVDNIEPDKLGEMIRSKNEGFVAWEIRGSVDFDHQLGNGKQQEPLETGLVTVVNQIEKVIDATPRRVFSMIRVVPKKEKTIPRIYNFGPLELDKAA